MIEPGGRFTEAAPVGKHDHDLFSAPVIQEAKERAILVALQSDVALMRRGLSIVGVRKDGAITEVSSSRDYDSIWPDCLDALERARNSSGRLDTPKVGVPVNSDGMFLGPDEVQSMRVYLIQFEGESRVVEAFCYEQAVYVWRISTDAQDEPESVSVLSDQPVIRPEYPLAIRLGSQP